MTCETDVHKSAPATPENHLTRSDVIPVEWLRNGIVFEKKRIRPKRLDQCLILREMGEEIGESPSKSITELDGSLRAIDEYPDEEDLGTVGEQTKEISIAANQQQEANGARDYQAFSANPPSQEGSYCKSDNLAKDSRNQLTDETGNDEKDSTADLAPPKKKPRPSRIPRYVPLDKYRNRKKDIAEEENAEVLSPQNSESKKVKDYRDLKSTRLLKSSFKAKERCILSKKSQESFLVRKIGPTRRQKKKKVISAREVSLRDCPWSSTCSCRKINRQLLAVPHVSIIESEESPIDSEYTRSLRKSRDTHNEEQAYMVEVTDSAAILDEPRKVTKKYAFSTEDSSEESVKPTSCFGNFFSSLFKIFRKKQ